MKIDSSNYLTMATLQAMQMNYPNQNMRVSSKSGQQTGKDSFESTLSETEAAIPSESYSNIMEIIKANKQANGESESAPTESDFAQALAQYEESSEDEDTTTVTDETEATDSTEESSGSGSDSSSEETTTTEVLVGRDGSTYLKTTTTAEDGTETITVTQLSSGATINNGEETGQTDMSQMQQGPQMMQMNQMQQGMGMMQGMQQMNFMQMPGMQNERMNQMQSMMPPTGGIDESVLEQLTSDTEEEVETA